MRPVLLLVLAALLTGCGAATHLVDVSNPTDRARAEATVVGRQAEIALVSGGRYAGSVEFVRLDSTAWTAGADLYVVPTPDVRSLTVEDRQGALGRGVLVGAGASFGVCFLAGAALADGFGGSGEENLSVGAVLGLGCVPAGLLYGLLGGSLIDARTTLVFVPPPLAPDGPPADAPDGRADAGSAGDAE